LRLALNGVQVARSSEEPVGASWATITCSYYDSTIEWHGVLHHLGLHEGQTITVTVSPKYQVVIPQAVRESLGIRPGQKVQVIRREGRIELIPLHPVQETRGFPRGIDTTVERDRDRL
jgi:AbrB family looped-hinge helix DNA binding protein